MYTFVTLENSSVYKSTCNSQFGMKAILKIGISNTLTYP